MFEGMYRFMEKAPANLMKEFVNSQQFESAADVMLAMKEMFADVLQQVMEGELDEQLGYEKSQRVSNGAVESSPKNYRNGYSKKTVKTQLGEVEISIPRDRNGEYEPQIIAKYDRNAEGMEEKNHRIVRMRHVAAGHFRTDQGAVRCGLSTAI